MPKETSPLAATVAALSIFDLSNLKAADTAPLNILHPVSGLPTGWKWEMAGPGHPKTIALQETMLRKRQHEERLKEQARVNGRKWKGDDRDPDEVRRESVENIAARVVTFDKVQLDNETIDYSPESCIKLLLNPNFGWVFGQVIEFLGADDAFFTTSAKS